MDIDIDYIDIDVDVEVDVDMDRYVGCRDFKVSSNTVEWHVSNDGALIILK